MSCWRRKAHPKSFPKGRTFCLAEGGDCKSGNSWVEITEQRNQLNPDQRGILHLSADWENYFIGNICIFAGYISSVSRSGDTAGTKIAEP